jgi:hypothetical protein
VGPTHLSAGQALQQSLVQVVAAAVVGIALGLLVVPVVAQVAMLLVAHVLALLVILADILRSKVTQVARRIMHPVQALVAAAVAERQWSVITVSLFRRIKVAMAGTACSGLLPPVHITAAAAAVQAFLPVHQRRLLVVLAAAVLVLLLSPAQTGVAA